MFVSTAKFDLGNVYDTNLCKDLKLFKAIVAFYTETSHLIQRANQMTGFYIKYNTGLKWVNKNN